MLHIRKLLTILLLLLIANSLRAQYYTEYLGLEHLTKGKDYLSDKLIVKLKSANRYFFEDPDAIANTVFDNAIVAVEQMFPGKKAPATRTNALGQEMVDISLIFILNTNTNSNLTELINRLMASGIFEYVEPYFIPQSLHTPNDPFTGLQYHLQNIRAFDAWDIIKGDTNVVIGIVDTGTELAHADLQNNIKYNYDDPIDGIDNDNDGFTDNFHGWDIGEGDNNPDYVVEPHGIHVCGIASAVTNNGTGIAGVGYNCKFLPVKATNQFGMLTKTYQGIVYAADKNCKVINCSWGQPGAAGQFGQDIVNYAVYNMGSVVVAAAGNSSGEHRYFPASYDNVISVAATDANDIKWNQSSYSVYVDVTAPGQGIHSTWVNGTYLTSNGTSMAAPIVSACIAIIASKYPTYYPIQLTQLLKLTTDNIDTLPANMPWAGKLGTGRVNLYKALTMTNIPSVSMVSLNITDEEFGQYLPGDTMLLSGKFVNYLAPTTNVTCTLTSLSPHIVVVDSVIQFPGTFNTLDTVNSLTFPFKIFLKNTMPVSTNANFKLTYNATGYSESQYFSETFNVDYITVDTNKITTTFTSKSRIGYNDVLRYQGVGFLYENSPESQLTYGGLIIGLSPSQVSDNIYGSVSGSINNSFKTLSRAQKIVPSAVSDFDVRSIYNDSLAGTTAIKVEVTNNLYAWNNPTDEKFIITEYNIVNKGAGTLVNLYAGQFMDWDIPDVTYHKSDFDQNLKMGYSYSTQGSYYTAVKLLTSANYRFYAFDNINGIKVNDGFTNYEKYNALRTNKFQAGSFSEDNDIMNLFSSGPFTLDPGDTVKVAFALIAGDYLSDIQQSAAAAQLRYDGQTGIDGLGKQPHKTFVYPNPTGNSLYVAYNCNAGTAAHFSLTDISGTSRWQKSHECNMQGRHTESINVSGLSPGIYILRVSTGAETEFHKIVVY